MHRRAELGAGRPEAVMRPRDWLAGTSVRQFPRHQAPLSPPNDGGSWPAPPSSARISTQLCSLQHFRSLAPPFTCLLRLLLPLSSYPRPPGSAQYGATRSICLGFSFHDEPPLYRAGRAWRSPASQYGERGFSGQYYVVSSVYMRVHCALLAARMKLAMPTER